MVNAVAIVVGEEPYIAVSYLAPEHAWDSGFAVFSVPPEEVNDLDSELVHLTHLIEDYPDLQTAFALAREHGVVVLDESGEWIAEAR
jgi:hypothetical protein